VWPAASAAAIRALQCLRDAAAAPVAGDRGQPVIRGPAEESDRRATDDLAVRERQEAELRVDAGPVDRERTPLFEGPSDLGVEAGDVTGRDPVELVLLPLQAGSLCARDDLHAGRRLYRGGPVQPGQVEGDLFLPLDLPVAALLDETGGRVVVLSHLDLEPFLADLAPARGDLPQECLADAATPEVGGHARVRQHERLVIHAREEGAHPAAGSLAVEPGEQIDGGHCSLPVPHVVEIARALRD
jgi:hypothetical protein